MNFAWRIELTPDGDGLLVTSPAFPELTTFGADEADARAPARLRDDLDDAGAPVAGLFVNRVQIDMPGFLKGALR